MNTRPAEAAALADLIKTLEARLLEPAVRRSEAALTELLAPDFVEFGRSGRRYDRPAVIAALQAEPPAAVTLSDFRLRRLAPDVVLATFRTERVDPAGGPAAAALRAASMPLVTATKTGATAIGLIITASMPKAVSANCVRSVFMACS